MAKHIRRRQHRYGSSVSYSLGDMAGVLDGTVKTSDALMGLVIALAGAAGANFAINKLSAVNADGTAGMLPAPTSDATSGLPGNSTAWLKALGPAIGGLVLGGAAFYGEKKSNAGAGHLAGALVAGIGMSALKLLSAMSSTSPYFSDYVSYEGDYGLIMRDPAMGILMNERGQLAGEESYQIEGHLSDLAAASMAMDPEDAADALASFA